MYSVFSKYVICRCCSIIIQWIIVGLVVYMEYSMKHIENYGFKTKIQSQTLIFENKYPTSPLVVVG